MCVWWWRVLMRIIRANPCRWFEHIQSSCECRIETCTLFASWYCSSSFKVTVYCQLIQFSITLFYICQHFAFGTIHWTISKGLSWFISCFSSLAVCQVNLNTCTVMLGDLVNSHYSFASELAIQAKIFCLTQSIVLPILQWRSSCALASKGHWLLSSR